LFFIFGSSCSVPPQSAPPTLAPGPVKIVTIGDSQTAGYGDERVKQPRAGGYPAMLIVPVIALRMNSRVENLGQPIWDSSDVVHGKGNDPSALTLALEQKPQIICIWIGLNDLLIYNGPDQEQEALTRYTANIDTILHSLKDRGALLAIALLDDPSKRPAIATGEYIKGYDWAQQNTDLESNLGRLTRRTASYNEVIRQKAEQYNAVVVDLNDPLFTDPEYLSQDGLHPNSRGYQKIADIWYQALLPYLTTFSKTEN
jgi:lysophospholipase L1-like esterase